MYGAILGDIIGSPYEFDRGNKTIVLLVVVVSLSVVIVAVALLIVILST